MISFKDYLLIELDTYPAWVKKTVLLLTLKIGHLESQIKN
jgi:hypothetical protein